LPVADLDRALSAELRERASAHADAPIAEGAGVSVTDGDRWPAGRFRWRLDAGDQWDALTTGAIRS
jgi:hypothetical protein